MPTRLGRRAGRIESEADVEEVMREVELKRGISHLGMGSFDSYVASARAAMRPDWRQACSS